MTITLLESSMSETVRSSILNQLWIIILFQKIFWRTCKLQHFAFLLLFSLLTKKNDVLYLIDIPSFKDQPADFLYVLFNFFTLPIKKVKKIIKLFFFFLITNFLIYHFAFEIEAWITKNFYKRMFMYEIFLSQFL